MMTVGTLACMISTVVGVDQALTTPGRSLGSHIAIRTVESRKVAPPSATAAPRWRLFSNQEKAVHGSVGNLQPRKATSQEQRKSTNWWGRIFRGDLWKRLPVGKSDPKSRPKKLGFLRRSKHDQPSDELLVNRCRSLLFHDRELQGGAIHVYGDRGVLYLRGSVARESQRNRAVELARKTAGAKSIVNQLTVASKRHEWSPHNSVRLSMPRRISDAWRSAGPAGNPNAKFRAPPAPQRSNPASTTNSAEPIDTSAPKDDQRASAQRWPQARGAVVLGGPQVLPSRSGLPSVVTYLVYRPTVGSAGQKTTFTDPVWSATESVRRNRDRTTSSHLHVAATVNQYAPNHKPGPERWTLTSARRAIPAPPANGIDPGLIRSSWAPAQLADSVNAPQAPPRLGSETELRRDVDALLARHAPGIRYQLVDGDLTLFGNTAAAGRLDRLFNDLCDLPGVRTLSFQNLLPR